MLKKLLILLLFSSLTASAVISDQMVATFLATSKDTTITKPFGPFGETKEIEERSNINEYLISVKNNTINYEGSGFRIVDGYAGYPGLSAYPHSKIIHSEGESSWSIWYSLPKPLTGELFESSTYNYSSDSLRFGDGPDMNYFFWVSSEMGLVYINNTSYYNAPSTETKTNHKRRLIKLCDKDGTVLFDLYDSLKSEIGVVKIAGNTGHTHVYGETIEWETKFVDNYEHIPEALFKDIEYIYSGCVDFSDAEWNKTDFKHSVYVNDLKGMNDTLYVRSRLTSPYADTIYSDVVKFLINTDSPENSAQIFHPSDSSEHIHPYVELRWKLPVTDSTIHVTIEEKSSGEMVYEKVCYKSIRSIQGKDFENPVYEYGKEYELVIRYFFYDQWYDLTETFTVNRKSQYELNLLFQSLPEEEYETSGSDSHDELPVKTAYYGTQLSISPSLIQYWSWAGRLSKDQFTRQNMITLNSDAVVVNNHVYQNSEENVNYHPGDVEYLSTLEDFLNLYLNMGDIDLSQPCPTLDYLYALIANERGGEVGILNPAGSAVGNQLAVKQYSNRLEIAGVSEDLQYHIYNLNGRVLLKGDIDFTGGVQVIPTGNISSGIYILKIKTDDLNSVKTFVKH